MVAMSKLSLRHGTVIRHSKIFVNINIFLFKKAPKCRVCLRRCVRTLPYVKIYQKYVTNLLICFY